MAGARILMGAPKSGSGKTFLTCALLQACLNRGKTVRSYKCGPDYIDPMFHRSVLGIRSGNLDSYFSSEEEIWSRVARETRQQDITVIEGVMGYYDGLGGNTTSASAYDIARITRTPSVLVIDGKGMSLSMGALIRGFREFRADSQIKAVIANRTGAGMAGRLKEIAEDAGCIFLGCFPERPKWRWESRHLGLMLPEEVDKLKTTLEEAAEEMERHLDLDRLFELAETAPALPDPVREKTAVQATAPVRVAVARDEAFCFYYEENLELLEKMGARLVFFSPLHDSRLPAEADGILLGGGYPELYARELSENISLRQEIRNMSEAGMPVIGECGGFLYLLEELEGADGILYPMAGALAGRGIRRERLVRFGYGEFTAERENCFLEKGEAIRGHEFHYWDSEDNGAAYQAQKTSGQSYPCIRRERATEAGFPHLYYPSAPAYAKRFLEACGEFQVRKTRRRI